MFFSKFIHRALPVCLAVAGYAQASPYQSPTVGAKYHYNSNLSGNLVVEILSVSTDRYDTKTIREKGDASQEARLFGITTLPKASRQGVLPGDAQKAAAFFPLQVGKKVIFDNFGTPSTGGRWFRANTWEALGEYKLQIGDVVHPVFVLRIVAESPGFYKSDGICDYSVIFAACIRVEGDLFVRDNPQITGRVSSRMTKAVVGGKEIEMPPLPTAGSAGVASPPTSAALPTQPPVQTQVQPAAQTPAPAPAPVVQSPPQPRPAVAPAPIPAASPAAPPAPPAPSAAAEQRLKQAKDLLDKKLITQQQYDEFVSRIMKEM